MCPSYASVRLLVSLLRTGALSSNMFVGKAKLIRNEEKLIAPLDIPKASALPSLVVPRPAPVNPYRVVAVAFVDNSRKRVMNNRPTRPIPTTHP